MDNLLEFLDKDRQRVFDFFSDTIVNKRLSEPESVNLITKVLSEYNDKLLAIVENMKNRNDELREKELQKYYETLLEEYKLNLDNFRKLERFGVGNYNSVESF